MKRYLYKIYDNAGTYIKTINDVSDKHPRFNWSINGGVGSLTLNIARSFEDTQDSDDLKLYNELRVVVNDRDDNGKQVYSGYLNQIRMRLDKEGNEFVSCQFLGYFSELSVRVLEFSTGETALYYTSDAPEEILKDVIDKYAGKITYEDADIGATGNTTTILYNLNTIREALDRVLSSCPIGWYYYIDGENKIYLARTNKASPDHTLYIGKHINEFRTVQNMEDVRNDIRVVGGTPDGEDTIYKKYKSDPSIDEFGVRTQVLNDGRVYNDTSLNFLGEFYLGSQYAKEIEMEFDVLDSNIDGTNGYDIESISPGDVIRINNPRLERRESFWDLMIWDIDYWDYNVETIFADPFIVESIDYYGTGARIRVARAIQGIGFRLADVKRNIENYLNSIAPADPSAEDTINFTYDENGDLIGTTE